jgi:hypothetical protein
MELRFDQDSASSYLAFSKNRRGSVNKRMYFSLSATGNVEYDLRRFSNDEDARVALAQERSLLESEESAFDELFMKEKTLTSDI